MDGWREKRIEADVEEGKEGQWEICCRGGQAGSRRDDPVIPMRKNSNCDRTIGKKPENLGNITFRLFYTITSFLLSLSRATWKALYRSS